MAKEKLKLVAGNIQIISGLIECGNDRKLQECIDSLMERVRKVISELGGHKSTVEWLQSSTADKTIITAIITVLT